MQASGEPCALISRPKPQKPKESQHDSYSIFSGLRRSSASNHGTSLWLSAEVRKSFVTCMLVWSGREYFILSSLPQRLPTHFRHLLTRETTLSPPLLAIQPLPCVLGNSPLRDWTGEWIREPLSKSNPLRALVLPLACGLCLVLLELGLLDARGCSRAPNQLRLSTGMLVLPLRLS